MKRNPVALNTSLQNPALQQLHALFERTRGVILDFDGLLADSEPFHYRAYNEVFERYGHSLDPDEYWVEWTSKGKGIPGEIERHNLDLGIEPEKLREQKFEVYSRFCKNGDIPLFPETKPLGERLNRRHKVAIASGSWRHDIEAILDHADARHLFPTILGKGQADKEKPHPDIFLNAAQALDVAPADCLVIEDALKGLDAALQAGMACLIIRNPLNQNIPFDGANLILPSLKSLLDTLR